MPWPRAPLVRLLLGKSFRAQGRRQATDAEPTHQPLTLGPCILVANQSPPDVNGLLGSIAHRKSFSWFGGSPLSPCTLFQSTDATP